MPRSLPVLSLSAGEAQKALIQQLTPRRAPVIWVDNDAEVVFDVPTLRVALRPGMILIEASFISDQTNVAPLVFPFSVGQTPHDAVLVAVTEELGRGHRVIASRWSEIAQAMLWRSLLLVGHHQITREFSDQDLVLGGIYVDEALHFVAAPRTTLKDFVARTRG